MTAEIVVIGSANMDMVVEVDRIPRSGETVLGGDLQRTAGGKGANQAVAAARLGRSVAMVGRVGDDENGEMLRAALERDGVDTTHLITTHGVPTGVALIAVGENGDNSIVVSPGANEHLEPDDLAPAEELLSKASCVLVQLEIPVATVAAGVRAAGGTIILNPAPAPTGALPAALLTSVDILVPNQTELANLAGHDGPVGVEVAADLARTLPVASVVVTLGAAGALVVNSDALHVPAPAVTPVDTTGAGDSFCGALADGIVGGQSLVEATQWAVRVGAATTLGSGAQPSLPTTAEVDSLLATASP